MTASLDPAGLLAIAEAAVDGVEDTFRAGLGARPARFKGEGDFATDIDLAIETQLRQTLTQLTGIRVFGEEFGGAEAADGSYTTEGLENETVWVVDPVDGTANYSAGNPMCGILVALVHEANPVVAVASFPLLGRRVAAAEGVALRSVGGPAAGFGGGEDALGFEDSRGHVGCSSHLRTAIYQHLRHTGLRPRMSGSVGLDSAFVAQGVFDGALNFSQHPWDNAAGALLVKAAGGVVTDVDGNEWTAHSRGLVVGTPQVHATLLDAIQAGAARGA
ncbi:inositol monophosphatase family protein [uncultured Corynebacterium sp.]|uniref:inositol monophosphatase family protein n=1 Tax=uncultured Corynebacterium sp. TaxID=159447 RepID=UPI0025F9E235|nr:inositol monophosphatase family protein [uncultured Corynebacterium sp.]